MVDPGGNGGAAAGLGQAIVDHARETRKRPPREKNGPTD
jgi:hypothetical protein